MRKVLYIQIDNNPLPEGCGEDVEVLDCRCINDFCSLVGDALVGDLKDESGKPLYRLINPVGKLLMDFKAVDEKSFDSIIDNWYDILANLLHKGIQEDDVTIKFPQQYVDWLLHNDNPYYEQVGKELQKANGKITLSSKDIDDDIIASLNYKVSHALQQKKEYYSCVVFSNELLESTSTIVTKINISDGNLSFMSYREYKLGLLEDYRLFRIEKLFLDGYIILGETKETDIDDWDFMSVEYGVFFEFKNDILNKIELFSDNADDLEKFNEISSIIWGYEVDFSEISFNSWQEKLHQKGFIISANPKWVNWEGQRAFLARLTKETTTFICNLCFLDTTISSFDLEDAKNKQGSLWKIDVSLK